MSTPTLEKQLLLPRVGSSGLVNSDGLPDWYLKPYITTDYRSIGTPTRRCLTGLFPLHNETFNILTHLLPGLVFLTLAIPNPIYDVRSFVPFAEPIDIMVIRANCMTAAACFLVSATYHALQCHSKEVHDGWLRCDYVGILGQIGGCFFSGIYVGFYCEETVRRVHIGINLGLCLIGAFVVLNPRLQTPRWKLLRLMTFVSIGASAILPLGHMSLTRTYHDLQQYSGIHYYYFEAAFYITGALVYGFHFPECRFPVIFDKIGSSHQIFHICVAISAVIHMVGIKNSLQMHYNQPICL